MAWGKVVAGQFVNATVTPNRKGDLSLQVSGMAALKRRPTLTADNVTSWEEIVTEAPGGAADVASKVGQAVARAALRGAAGRAAAAAVDSAVDSMVGVPRTVRVDWADGNQSLIRLPGKLFQHLAIMLEDRQIATAETPAAPAPEEPPGVIGRLAALAQGATAPDAAEQIARLAELRDSGALTDDEFAAKKAELLGRI